MGKKIPDEMKKKLMKRLSEYGDFYGDLLGQLANLDKNKLPIRKAYKENWNRILYYGDEMVEEHGRAWTGQKSVIEDTEKKMLEWNLLRNKLFDERAVEWEESKESWIPALEKFLIEQYGPKQCDSLGITYIYGSGNSSLVLLSSMRFHTMSAGMAGPTMELYRPMVSVTSLNQGSN